MSKDNRNSQAEAHRLISFPRTNLPSLVQLIDRSDPSPRLYEFAEFNLPVSTSGTGNGDRPVPAHRAGRSRFLPWFLLAVVFAAGVAFWFEFLMEASK